MTKRKINGAFGMVLSRKAYSIVGGGELHIDGGTAAYQRLVGGLFVAGVCLLIVKRREIAKLLHAAEAKE